MLPSLSRRERTIIVASAGAVLLVALYFFVVEPLLARYRELGELAPAREATLDTRRRLIAQRPRLIEELAEVNSTLEKQTERLLPGAPARRAGGAPRGAHRAHGGGQHPRHRRPALPHRADEPAAHREGSQGARGRRRPASRAHDHARGRRLPPAPGREQLMPRRLLVLNVALGLVSLFFAVGIVRALLVKHPLPKPTAPRAVAPAPPMVTAAASDASAEAYAAIAAQNLFNPGRSE